MPPQYTLCFEGFICVDGTGNSETIRNLRSWY